MIKALRFLSVSLLLFNGIGALYGGGLLMNDPTGQKIQLPLSYLHYSPFTDYFIPGIVLFLFNGILSLTVAGLALIRRRHYAQFVVLQGAILCGWIIIQVLMVRNIYYLHYIMGFVGMALVGSGIILTLKDSPTKKHRSTIH